MNFNLNLSKREITELIVAVIVIALVLSITIELPIVGFEFLNFIEILLLSLLLVAVFTAGGKFIAHYLDAHIEHKLLSFRQYWFKSGYRLKFDFPAWFILPMILLFATNGIIRWLAILNFDVHPKATRVRKRWTELTEVDIAKIAIAGPIAVLLLGLVSKVAGFNSFAYLCAWFVFLMIIPIGQGFKLLMGSRILWFFAFIFSLAILLLMNLTGVIVTIIIAILIAALATLAYYILYEK